MNCFNNTLACPIDNLALDLQGQSLVCANGHNYDISKKGYVNLLPVQDKRSKHPGDSKEMVLARKHFLDAGYYTSIVEKLIEIVSLISLSAEGLSSGELSILDAGCGEGYYLDRLYSNHLSTSCIGLDISKDAIVESAKRNKNITWIVGTNRKLPVMDNSVDVILCMFGFPSVAEFARVLKPKGFLLCVDPGLDHLIELRKLIYDEIKAVNTTSTNTKVEFDAFLLIKQENIVQRTTELKNSAINNLLKMTPHFYRATKEKREAATKLQSLLLSIDVCFSVFQLV